MAENGKTNDTAKAKSSAKAGDSKPDAATPEGAKSKAVATQISDNLNSYQEAVQGLMDVLVHSGTHGHAMEGTETGIQPVWDFTDTHYLVGMQKYASGLIQEMQAANQKIWTQAVQRPDLAYQKLAHYWQERIRIGWGQSNLQPAKGDRRFHDPQWTENPFYKQSMQNYLALHNYLDEWVEDLPLEHHELERVRFAVSLYAEALAPSNWPNNPEALKRYVETNGQSAVRGLRNLIDDIVHNGGLPSTVKEGALKVGEDLANTPGKVVHRTEVFELIQYAPMTDEVRARPFLMVPPQINRFYFYDLSPKKSLIRFCVESGLQVFAISWRNPTPAQRDWDFDTYISALDEAIDVVTSITGSPDVNIEGGCIAGMQVSGLLSSHAAQGKRKVNSATLMVTMLDTSADSELCNLAAPEMIEMAKIYSSSKGVMDGSEMTRIFALMRPNDLIWSYWVNNYLLGNDPPVFDVLAWNADTTRMAAGLHGNILEIVRDNSLVDGTFPVLDRAINLAAIDCDQFWLAGSSDHITPWRGCYASARRTGGAHTFVLSDGGHIQSMISSPSNPKATFHVGTDQPEDPDAWLASAAEHKSSWWLFWRDWITERSGDLKKAPGKLGTAQHPALADAPGTYVFE